MCTRYMSTYTRHFCYTCGYFQFNVENSFFFLSAAPPGSQIGCVGEVQTQSQTVVCSIPAKPDIQFIFSGHPWIPMLQQDHAMLGSRDGLFTYWEQCISHKCKLYQCESNCPNSPYVMLDFSEPPNVAFRWCGTQEKKNHFPHWIENSCKCPHYNYSPLRHIFIRIPFQEIT